VLVYHEQDPGFNLKCNKKEKKLSMVEQIIEKVQENDGHKRILQECPVAWTQQ
jgi:hypothetical protein